MAVGLPTYIGTLSNSARKYARGSVSVITNVLGSGASILATIEKSCDDVPRPLSKYIGWFGSEARSKFHLMAAASSGVPSWNFTPWRILNVYTLPSGDTCHDSASTGLIGRTSAADVRSKPTRDS